MSLENADAPLGHAGSWGYGPQAALRIAAGRYLDKVQTRLSPTPYQEAYGRGSDLLGIIGIYVCLDRQRRIVYLGQAKGGQGIGGRLIQHDREPEKMATFAFVVILALIDTTPGPAVDVIEGKCADMLDLRGRLRSSTGLRQWPSAKRWPEIIAAA